MINRITWLISIMILAGCQTFAGDDVSVTLESEMTAFATESVMIRQAAQAEQTQAVETVVAMSTTIADVSNVNAVLAATVRANIAPTPAMREVIVNPDDMGSSLETDMMEENADVSEVSGDIQVNNVGIARSVRTSDGCSNGVVSQFTDNDERIYVTAQVQNLQSGVTFSVDWVFEERLVYRTSWTTDYSAQSECIWFYMTQDDAPFLPGVYTATLFLDGNALSPQQFSISTG